VPEAALVGAGGALLTGVALHDAGIHSDHHLLAHRVAAGDAQRPRPGR
jgi:hypothetical protein